MFSSISISVYQNRSIADRIQSNIYRIKSRHANNYMVMTKCHQKQKDRRGKVLIPHTKTNQQVPRSNDAPVHTYMYN